MNSLLTYYNGLSGDPKLHQIQNNTQKFYSFAELVQATMKNKK